MLYCSHDERHDNDSAPSTYLRQVRLRRVHLDTHPLQMRIFPSSVLIFARLLYLPLPGAALDGHGADVGLRGCQDVSWRQWRASCGAFPLLSDPKFSNSKVGSPDSTDVGPWACEYQAVHVQDTYSCPHSTPNPTLPHRGPTK